MASWAVVIFVLLCYPVAVTCFKIGAFNIQVFGQSKTEKPDVLQALGKILRRYDVVLIQEIRDAQGTAIDTLLNQVNGGSETNYTYIISDRLGRSTSKEQYAYIYKNDGSIEVLDTYTFNDGDEATSSDTFEREPFMAKFNFKYTRIGTVVLGGVHIKPSEAFAEINQLNEVFDDIKRRWNTDDIIMMGDMNAGCSYLSNSKYNQLVLTQDPSFYWPLGRDVDTTVAASSCAYDRFIITGAELITNIVNGSAGVFRFDTAYGYNATTTERISDHYPIEISLIDDVPKPEPVSANQVRIGSFDISSFGQTKASKQNVLKAIALIIQRYHAIFLQGIRDSRGTAIQALLEEVNRDQIVNYILVLSERVGRTTQEQYAIMYRNNSDIDITEHYIYDDSSLDRFDRDPFVATMRFTGMPDLSFIGVHVKSNVAAVELAALYDVHAAIQRSSGSDEIILMGNMFADCSYISQSRLDELALRGSQFSWPIGDAADTTTGNSDCAYDRIILTGGVLQRQLNSTESKVFDFESFYRYDDVFANDISEHHPVDVVFDKNVVSITTTTTTTSSSVTESITPAPTSAAGASSSAPPSTFELFPLFVEIHIIIISTFLLMM